VTSDKGVVMRRILREAIQAVKEGRDPKGIIRGIPQRQPSFQLFIVPEASSETKHPRNCREKGEFRFLP
jgi:hypothetical protein